MTALLERFATVVQNERGRSLVAAIDVPAGIRVAHFAGPLVSTADLPESEICYALWLAEDRWMIPQSSARYINHSCDPNCRVNDDLEVITLRTVRAGEEFSFAYNVVHPGEVPPEWDPRWSFRCLCGAAECRGGVDGWVFE